MSLLHYTVICTGAVCFNHVRSIISVLPNAATVPWLGYNAISTFIHQILRNMTMDFDLWWQICRKATFLSYATRHVNLQFLNSIYQQMLLICYNACIVMQFNMIKTMTSQIQSKHCCPLEPPTPVVAQILNLLISFLIICARTFFTWSSWSN